MRFIFVSLGYYPELVGGAYRYVTEVAQRLADRGHGVEVLFPAAAGAPAAMLERRGVRLHSFANASGHFVGNWLKENLRARGLLRALLNEEAPERTLLVACHAFFGPALMGMRAPSAFLFTGPWAEEYQFSRMASMAGSGLSTRDRVIARVMRLVERSALRKAGSILTISRYYELMLPKWHGVGLPPVRMISGGVDPQRFRPEADRLAVRQGLGLNPEDRLFFTLRRLDPRMGLLRLIGAFGEATQSHPRARLWLGGTGPQKAELEGHARGLGLGERVRLLGFIPDAELCRYYTAADCTVMPSLDLEGFGLATVESLACGTPVLGSGSGATPELLEGLDPAMVFESGREEALAGKLGAILNGKLRLPDREACRAHVVRNFSWETPVRGLEDAWTELVGGKR